MDNVLLDIGLPLVLAFVMVGIGLTLTLADFDRQRKTPKPLVVGVFGQAVVVPLVALGIAVGMNLAPELAIGVVLLGATAGGTTSNVMTYLGRGNTPLSLVLTVLANLASILTIPFWAGIALERWGDDVTAGANVTVGFMDVAGLLAGLVLVPTSLGMLVRAKRPALAARLENTVSRVSFIVLFALIIGVTFTLDDAWTLLRQAGPATLLLTCAATGIGVLLGILSRLPKPDHVALGMEFGIKNITLTMLLALTALGSEEIALPAAVYGVLAYIPGMALLVFARRRYIPAPAGPATQLPARKPVLVGYDGSKATLPALRWAAQEATASQRSLHVVLAWGLPTMGFSPVSASADLDRRNAQGALSDAMYLLEKAFPGLRVDSELVEDKPSQALVDRSAGAAMVVVGHQSKGKVGRMVLGSVAAAVVAHADAPVVVVRGNVGGEVARVGPIVVGVDGSPGSEEAVRFAYEAAPQHGYKVTTVHAGTVTSDGLQSVSAALRECREQNPAVEVREVVRAGNAAQLIGEAAKDAALVVVGSRGHGGVAGMLLGSVSRAVVEQAETPVVVLRHA